MLERRLYEANVKSREGSFKTKGPSDFLGNEINGKTFGQIGMGNIAQRIAHIMSAGFGCKVLACDTFVEEPVSPDNKLLTLRNFSATPHLGGNTEEALQKTGMQVVRDTLAVLGGDLSTAHRIN